MITLEQLRTVLAATTGVEAVCVGDVMLDRFVHGQVSRVSPEAPIPVFARAGAEAMLGGAGNVARNLVALGGRCVLLGAVGTDAEADELAALAAAEPGLEARLTSDPGRPTTCKTRFVAGGQQLLRADVETSRPVPAAVAEALSRALAASSPGVILVSDYAKGVVTPAVLDACRAAAARTGAPLVVDPKGRDFARYGAVDLIKPNARELAELTGLPTGSDVEVEAALARALELCEARALLVTRAEAGMSLVVRGGGVRHLPAQAREVFDVSGAGDTVLAALGAALGGGADLETAAAFALLASGLVVGKAGTAVVTPAELLRAEVLEQAAPIVAKLADAQTARARVEDWRRRGLKVGFTNGCFDILHAGHVDYLARARAACDRLVVGVNGDGSIRRLKGEGRPVNDLHSRALVLAALGAVDMVAPFDDDTPLALIEALRPDVLVKGADYDRAGVVGADEVESWGGRVVLAPLVQGYSTTAAIARIGRAADSDGGAGRMETGA